MDTVKRILEERNLPDLLNGAADEISFLKRQKDITDILLNQMYGEMPKKPEHMSVELVSEYPTFAAGSAVCKELKLIFTNGDDSFSFPIISIIPKSDKKLPAFVNLSFFNGDQNKYTPSEEICNNGFALFSFCYKDVASDDDNFKSGIAKYLVKSRKKANASSKISLWAWAAMRVMDYIETLDEIDTDNVAVIGHSRLGKTALLAGGIDKRFKYVISNESGCAGAAIERGKVGETYKLITERFPFWFCPSFIEKATKSESFNFDQHFLAALTVPRTLIIGSAEEDLWADPASEFLCAASLDEAYAIFGKKGLLHNDEIPTPKSVLDSGEACYYVRKGTHYLSRHDWNTYCDIIKRKISR